MNFDYRGNNCNVKITNSLLTMLVFLSIREPRIILWIIFGKKVFSLFLPTKTGTEINNTGRPQLWEIIFEVSYLNAKVF